MVRYRPALPDLTVTEIGLWSLRSIDSGRQAVSMSGNRGAMSTIRSGAVRGLRLVSDTQPAASAGPNSTSSAGAKTAAVVSYVMRRAERESAQCRMDHFVVAAVQVLQQRRTAA